MFNTNEFKRDAGTSQDQDAVKPYGYLSLRLGPSKSSARLDRLLMIHAIV